MSDVVNRWVRLVIGALCAAMSVVVMTSVSPAPVSAATPTLTGAPVPCPGGLYEPAGTDRCAGVTNSTGGRPRYFQGSYNTPVGAIVCDGFTLGHPLAGGSYTVIPGGAGSPAFDLLMANTNEGWAWTPTTIPGADVNVRTAAAWATVHILSGDMPAGSAPLLYRNLANEAIKFVNDHPGPYYVKVVWSGLTANATVFGDGDKPVPGWTLVGSNPVNGFRTVSHNGTASVTLDNATQSAVFEIVNAAPGNRVINADSRRQSGRQAVTAIPLLQEFTPREPFPEPDPTACSPDWVSVVKTSSDDYFSVEGTTFELRDATGVLVGTAAPINGDPVVLLIPPRTIRVPDPNNPPPATICVPNPAWNGPYRWVEVHTAPGLAFAGASQVAIAGGENTFENVPNIEYLQLRKGFNGDNGQQPAGVGNPAGYRFSVTREDGRGYPDLITGVSGESATIRVTSGSYTLCEVVKPVWGQAFTDDQPCFTVIVPHHVDEIGVTTAVTPVRVDPYLNYVRVPDLNSIVSQTLVNPGDTFTEHVVLADSIDGRQLRVDRTWYESSAAETGAALVCTPATARMASSEVVSGSTSNQMLSVDFTVPSVSLDGSYGVAYWSGVTVTDVATGIVVATHPCGDVYQRVVVPSIESITPIALRPGENLTDRYKVVGAQAGVPSLTTPGTLVAPGAEWTLTATFPVYDITNGCSATSPLVGEIPAEAISADGTFTTSGHLNLPDAGVYVVRERLTATYTVPRYVPGTDEVTPGTTWVWPDDVPFQPPFGTNTFVDLNGNGVGPEIGVYIDSNGNGVRDDNVWVDRNGNGIQDLLGYVDGNDNGIQDPTEPGYAPETGYTEPLVDEPAGVVGPTEELVFESTVRPCDRDEETWVPQVQTRVVDKVLEGQPSRDLVQVDGVPLAPLRAGDTVTVVGGLYWHDPLTPVSSWVCTTANLVSNIADIVVTGAGQYLSDPITGYPTGVALSYQEQLVVERDKTFDGVTTSTTWRTDLHGCRVPYQTQWAIDWDSQVVDKVLVGQPAADAYNVDGIGLVGDFNKTTTKVTLDPTWHMFTPGSNPATRVCDASNQVWAAPQINVDHDGEYLTAQRSGYATGKVYVWQASMTVTYTWPADAITSTVVGSHSAAGEVETWTVGSPKGCNDPNETQFAPSLSSKVDDQFVLPPALARDNLTTIGFGAPAEQGNVLAISLVGGIHAVPSSTPVGSRVCDASNMVQPVNMVIAGDGTVKTPGEKVLAGYLNAYNISIRSVWTRPDGTKRTYDLPYIGCNDEVNETVFTVALASAVKDQFLAAGDLSVDRLFVTGRGSSSASMMGWADPTRWTFEIRGGYYHHAADMPLDNRTCTSSNQLSSFVIPVGLDGEYLTTGERGIIGRSGSYSARLEVSRYMADGTVRRYSTPLVGCGDASETNYWVALTSQVANPAPAYGGENYDNLFPAGLPPAALVPGLSVSIDSELHRHPAGVQTAALVCDASSLVSASTISGVTAGGTYRTETVKMSGPNFSYQGRLVISTPTRTYSMPWTGCNEVSEGFRPVDSGGTGGRSTPNADGGNTGGGNTGGGNTGGGNTGRWVPQTGSSLGLLPMASALLLAGGVVLLISRRRRRAM